MAELRITWAELLRAGACVEALPAYQKAAKEHGDGVSIILPNGWTESHVRICMKLPGGAFWLSFLEQKEIVPVIESSAKKYPRVLEAQRKTLVERIAKRVEAARKAAANANR